MPARDSKRTGYRLTPSADERRIEAVREVFALYNEGLAFGQISDHLYARGVTYFGKAFGSNAVETILSNSAYIGFPEWGKVATGYYRQALGQEAREAPERKPTESLTYRKSKQDVIRSLEPVFPPIVDLKLWEQVQQRLDVRRANSKSKVRQRRFNHCLNGVVRCPDCGSRMVTSWGTKRSGEKVPYFICGHYAKTRNKECRANSVAHSLLDTAANEILDDVKAQLTGFASLSKGLDKIEVDEKKVGELFMRTLAGILIATGNQKLANIENDARFYERFRIEFPKIVADYKRTHEKTNKDRLKRIRAIEAEIDRLGEIIAETTNKQLRGKFHAKASELEKEQERLQSEVGVNLLDQLQTVIERAKALAKRIEELQRTRKGELFSLFVESVTPKMDVQTMSNGKTRTKVTGFVFTPLQRMSELFPAALEIECSRRGTG